MQSFLELDAASCGPTEETARKNLQEAVAIILEEVKKKGKLNELLEELGFQKEKQLSRPQYIQNG